jgi:hypothetical protein
MIVTSLAHTGEAVGSAVCERFMLATDDMLLMGGTQSAVALCTTN